MYIRQTPTRSRGSGESYFTCRLVRGERIGARVRQVTLLNLERSFGIARERWGELCQRIEGILHGQASLLGLSGELEEAARRCAARLVVRGGSALAGEGEAGSGSGLEPYVEVDVESLELLHPRSVGVEQAGLWAMRCLGFEGLLTELGFNGEERAAAMGSVIARMAAPGSELSSWQWLRKHSGLGELLGEDYGSLALTRLYRVSDQLLRHREEIEERLFSRLQTLFGLETRVTLYDLTNTYLEGSARGNRKAKRGHSRRSVRIVPWRPWAWYSTATASCVVRGFLRGTRWRRKRSPGCWRVWTRRKRPW